MFIEKQDTGSSLVPSQGANTGTLSIALLVAAGFGAMLFTLVAGFFLYANTQSLVAAKDWVEHTQEVLTSLQTASLQVDRIEFSTRLFLVNKDERELNTARLSAISLETIAFRVEALVQDNPAQLQSGKKLSACASGLNRAVRSLSPESEAPSEPLLRCREVLSLMGEQERGLLKQRSQQSQHSSVVSLTTECAFVALSLLTLVVVFCFLVRDALHRRRLARQTLLSNEHLEASVHALEERMQESRLLTSCRDELQLCMTVEQVYRSAADCLARLLPRSTGSLAIINNSRHMVGVVSSWGADSGMHEIFAPEACCGLRLGQLRWRRKGLSEIDCAHYAEAPARYLCVPMVAQGETLGVVSIVCEEEAAYLAVQQRMDGVRQLLQLTGMAVASLNLRTRLENQSIRDGLTGLFNRNFMQVALSRELSRAAREQTTLAVLMLDVDHFKCFNDTHGHGAGDAMLQSIAEAFTCSVRKEDIVCRYGGEEFAIILPGMTEEAASERAEAIRRSVSKLRIPLRNAPLGSASVSIGMAFYPSDAAEGEALLRKADQALYMAKHNGRDQVWMSGTPDSTKPALLSLAEA